MRHEEMRALADGRDPAEVERYLRSLSHILDGAPSDGALVVTGEPSSMDLLWAAVTGRPVHRHPIATAAWTPLERRNPEALDISLSFFANDEDGLDGPKYRLLLDAARLADERGLTAIWSPERHFHSFGGLYPSPTATSAALAAATRRIGIRAGSVVMPLHDPIRVAEEWAVIDNLSGGRVGVSFASGWHADDFVLAPDRYATRRDLMIDGIETVRRLWRGERIRRRNGNGDEVAVAIRPRPVQPELPFWFTAAGSPDTFRGAGEAGAFVLTNLMGQTLEDLVHKVRVYRRAWRDAGHSGAGHVTLMLHAFLAEDVRTAHAQARDPLLAYFRSSVDITRGFAASQGIQVGPEDLSEADLRALLEFGLERYLHDGGLFGTVDSCAAMVERVRAAGVDEVAALIDFGIPVDATLRGVALLADLGDRERARAKAVQRAAVTAVETQVRELAAWLRAHPVAAIQATPDVLGWLAEFAPEALRDRALLTEAGPRDEEILRRVAGLGGCPLVEPTAGPWIAAKARYGPGGELTVRPAREVSIVDAAGRPVGVGVVGRLALDGLPGPRARWRPDGTLDLLPTPPRPDVPLSFAQQRLWSLNHLTDSGIAYNNPVALRMRGTLDVAALTNALREVVRRHEVLRTTFPAGADGPRQVVRPATPMAIPVVDVRVPEDVDRLAREHARQPFDLATGPLLRARLLKLSEQEHILLISMHHIVSDGWSAGVLFTELAALYAAFADRLPSPLVPLPMQYTDYAIWQRERAAAPEMVRELGYWRDTLAGAPLLQLPMDRPRGPVQAHEGARHPVRIDRELTGAVRALCTSSGVTPFMVLQAALVMLMHRYSGQTDLVTGTTVAGRNRAEFEPLVGVFVNPIVIRTDASGDPTFAELLARVKTAALGAFAHQEVPFERVVDELKVARDLSLTPLFQVMLLLHNTPSPRVKLRGLTLEGLDIDPAVAKLDLMLELREDEDGIGGAWEYNTALFDPATIAQLTSHLNALLADAAARPDRRLSELAMISAPERADLLVLSRGEPLQPPAFGTVGEAFEAQAARTPDAGAIGDELTYRELDTRSNQLAHGLRARGVRPGSRVALLLDRPADVITAMIAVLKSGGAYVPLDPHSPPARREELLRRAGAVLALSDLDSVAAGHPQTRLEPLATGDDPAYVIFTSGSTGDPKGVVVSHAQLLYSTWARLAYYGEPAGRCVAPYPLTFDASVGWIYYALLTGGTLWTPTAFDPRELARLIRRVRADRFSAVPALYGQLLEAVEGDELTSLRTVSVIGERCAPQVPRLHFQRLPGVAFHNEYGPTEATVWCTSQPVSPDVDGEVPIGRPIPGAIALVLDGAGRLLPVGAPGELHVGGPGVAVGYLDDPDLTERRFVADHVTGSGRLYRTGDLARWTRRGELEFLGRIDRQVKVRGFRVEPAEIEAALAGHPEVAEAAVTAQSGPGSTRLVGYAVPRARAVLRPDDLVTFLRTRLPDYMVPAQLLIVAELPRTRHGKVDIGALPLPAETRQEVFVAPRDETERQLAEVVREVLGGVEVGVHDDFFELGGDSVLAITTVTRARNRGIEIDVRQLFQNPTVAGLAAVAGTAPAVPAEQGAVSGPVPLAPAQVRFFERRLANNDHWNGGLQLELTEPVEFDALQDAFRAVLAHHDALRLRFVLVDGQWHQHCAPDEPDWSLWRIDLSGVPAEQRSARLQEEATRLHASLNLASGPVFRAALVHLGEDTPDRLVLGAHHLCIDGLSWRMILEDLFTAYQRKPLPAKTTSYRDWSAGLREFVTSERGRAELDYWADLPCDRAPRVPRQGDGPNIESGVTPIRTTVDKDTTRILLRGDMQAALITAAASGFARWMGSEHVHLDVQRHGRADIVPSADITRTVGWFSITHPLVLNLPTGADAKERLARVTAHLDEVPWGGAGYAALRYCLPESPLANLPTAELGVNYQGRLDGLLPADVPARILDEPPGQVRPVAGPRVYLIGVLAAVFDEQLHMVWTYAEGIHERATIEALAREAADTLRELAS